MYRGKEYEQVAPSSCGNCGGREFSPRGRVGLWQGGFGSGCIYQAVCLTCQTVWESKSDPIACRDHPDSLTWRLVPPVG